MPLKPRREDVGAEQHHRAHFRFGERCANSAGVASNQIQLQLPQIGPLDVNLGKFSEPRIHAVNDGVASDDLFNHASATPRSPDRADLAICTAAPATATCAISDQRQGLSGQFHGPHLSSEVDEKGRVQADRQVRRMKKARSINDLAFR